MKATVSMVCIKYGKIIVGFLTYLILCVPDYRFFHNFIFMNGVLQSSRKPMLTKQNRETLIYHMITGSIVTV